MVSWLLLGRPSLAAHGGDALPDRQNTKQLAGREGPYSYSFSRLPRYIVVQNRSTAAAFWRHHSSIPSLRQRESSTSGHALRFKSMFTRALTNMTVPKEHTSYANTAETRVVHSSFGKRPTQPYLPFRYEHVFEHNLLC
eukprot:scaffold128463_cov46-Prasinocladus_malaysianus.AAC.2